MPLTPENLILDNVCRHIRLNAAEKQTFINCLEPRHLKRKQFLLSEGDVCKYSAFVTAGCLRGYTVDRGGAEHVIGFAPPDWWIADMYSLITQQPGMQYIEALEGTDVLLLAKTKQEELYAEVPKFERFFRVLTEKSLVASQQRIIDGLGLSAEERYNRFCERYPTLVHRLPKKQIALYIGVTPEFFSRMCAEMARKKFFL